MKLKKNLFASRGLDRRRDINALKKHIHALRNFTRETLGAGMDLNKIFECAMHYIFRELKCEDASIYLLDSSKKILKMQKMVSQGEILQGEEEIYLDEKNPLNIFLNSQNDFYTDKKSNHVLNIALREGSAPLGLLRVEPSRKKLRTLDREILVDFVRELTHIIQNVKLFLQNRNHMRILMASSEISSAIISALRLEEALFLVVKSIIKNLGFDRVRLYLIDKNKAILKGKVCADICGRIQDISIESYPLRKGEHKLTDVVLGGASDIILEKCREIIVHVPFKVKNQIIGLLVADNLLSRQKISEIELETLSSFVGHIGMAVENARLFKEIEQLSITDGLTKLYIYRYFKKRLTDELNRAERYDSKTILIMLDIDLFKQVNDTYGHLVGDTVLMEVANKIRESIRKIDFPARYGGDEFIVFLPHASEEIAHQVAERIFSGIQDCKVDVAEGKVLNISVSMGVAGYPDNAGDVDELIKKADEALYWGKTHGRNKLTFYGDIKQQ